MLTIVLDFEEGVVVPDHKVRDFVNKTIAEVDHEVRIGSEILLVAFREAVYQGRLPHKRVILRSSLGDQRLDRTGQYDQYPSECGILDDLLMTLLGWEK